MTASPSGWARRAGRSDAVDPELHDAEGSARRELATWAEPVIADRIFERYRSACADPERVAALAAQHRHLWRNVLLDQQALGSAACRELDRLTASDGVPPGLVRAIDKDIVAELMDIVVMRYRRSRGAAQRFGMIVTASVACVDALRSTG